MELFLGSDCEKTNRMRSSWHSIVVLVGLLLVLNLAAFLAELSQGMLHFHVCFYICVCVCVFRVIKICKLYGLKKCRKAIKIDDNVLT